MKVTITADAGEVAQLLKDIVAGVTKEHEAELQKLVKRAEAAADAAEMRLLAIPQTTFVRVQEK